MAVKFDFANDAGEGTNSTGLYVDGATPTVPAVSIPPGIINLRSDDTMDVHLTYDDAAQYLGMTITDIVTGATWSTSFPVYVEALVAGTQAYAGFTGSTSATGSSSQKIETWTYTAGPPTTPATAAPGFSLPGGAYSSAQKVMLADATANAKIYYTTDGSNPSTSSTLYSCAHSRERERYHSRDRNGCRRAHQSCGNGRLHDPVEDGDRAPGGALGWGVRDNRRPAISSGDLAKPSRHSRSGSGSRSPETLQISLLD